MDQYNKIMLLSMSLNAMHKKGVNIEIESLGIDTNELWRMKTKDFMEYYEKNANELMGVTQTGFGKEFVPEEILMAELIARFEDPNTMLNVLPAPRPMDWPTATYPLQGEATTLSSAGENVDVPGYDNVTRKRLNTATIEIKAFKLKDTIGYSEELLEDSVIMMGAYVLERLVKMYGNSIIDLIVNGDTDTDQANNINTADGTGTVDPTATYINIDGARKLAISNSRTVDAGTIDFTDFLKARALMKRKGLNPAELIAVCDVDTYSQLLALPEFRTIDVAGGGAVNQTGTLASVGGITIYPSDLVKTTKADGKVSVTPANNTKGSITLIHLPSLLWAVYRAFRTQTKYDSTMEQFEITGSTRIAMKIVEENGAPSSAVIRNVTLS